MPAGTFFLLFRRVGGKIEVSKLLRIPMRKLTALILAAVKLAEESK